MEPKLPVKVTKKLKTLTFTHDDSSIALDIEEDCIDIIKLDIWISDLLFGISKPELEKQELRKRLMGE